MADRRYTLVFYAAIVVAAGATFGVYRTLEATKAQSRIVTQPVVVASQDMPEGRLLTLEQLKVEEWPVATVPAGAFSSVDSLIGRVTRVSVFTGEAMVPGRLAPAGTGPGLEVKITPGKRAMAIRINDVAGVSGLLQPNSRVDVMVTLKDSTATMNVAKLFMENMRVLSVGTRVDRDAQGKPIGGRTVALEVTPKEAEELAIAENAGALHLVLRGYGETDSVRTDGAVARDVLARLRDGGGGAARMTEPAPRRTTPRRPPAAPRAAAAAVPAPVLTPAQPVAPAVPTTHTVEVYRGSKPTKQQFNVKGDSIKPDSTSGSSPR